MSHTIALPDDTYQAIADYAARQGQSPEAIIQEWAASLRQQLVEQPTLPDEQRIDDPRFDPWAGFRNATTALSPDSIDRHDEYLAQEAASNHESE